MTEETTGSSPTPEVPGASGARGPVRRAEPRADGYTEEGSWGAISERHWTRTRAEMNREALDYYRERSHAPGVAEGGSHRNFYCMKCDGVIPYYEQHERCPHCGEPIDPTVKRYFNWVETDFPRKRDLTALLPWALVVLLAALLAAAALAYWLFR